jgi:hypothetical protein
MAGAIALLRKVLTAVGRAWWPVGNTRFPRSRQAFDFLIRFRVPLNRPLLAEPKKAHILARCV